MTHSVLRIEASARHTGSVSRSLTGEILEQLGDVSVVTRDLAAGLPLLTEDWVNANFTPAESRTEAQVETLALSDTLVAEIEAADTLVIGLPIYNFGVPAAFKAWVDLVARAGVTFRYTESGPVGLFEGKRAIIAVTSGGTEAGSALDFATGFARHVLGFIGIHDVTVVAADRLMVDAAASMATAKEAIATLEAA